MASSIESRKVGTPELVQDGRLCVARVPAKELSGCVLGPFANVDGSAHRTIDPAQAGRLALSSASSATRSPSGV